MLVLSLRSQKLGWSTLTQFPLQQRCASWRLASSLWLQSLETSRLQTETQVFLFVSLSLWLTSISLSLSYLYQIAHLGDDDDEPEFSSAMPLEEGDTFFFQPRPLKNLVLVDEQENLSPIMSCQVSVLSDEHGDESNCLNLLRCETERFFS